MRLVGAAALLGCILLAGCSRQSVTVQPTDAVRSVDLSAAVAALYGDRLESSSRRLEEEPWDRPEAHQLELNLELASGEPTGSEPFVLLSALRRERPGMRLYSLSFELPGRRWRLYHWTPEKRLLVYSDGGFSGSLGTALPMGKWSGVTTAALDAVADGLRPVPACRPVKRGRL